MSKRTVAGLTAGLAAVVSAALAGAVHGAPPPDWSDERQVFVVQGVATKEQRSALVAAGIDVAEARANSVVVVATDAERDALSAQGLAVAETAETPLGAGAEPTGFPAEDSGYHDYGEMVADVRAVAAAHPGTVHLFSLGTSYEGRDLIAARVSDDPTDRTDEPGVLFVGQHHAREHLTVEVVLSLLHLFAESNDPQIRSLVTTRQIYIVPSLNPDGGEYDISTGSYAYWRKNRQPTPGSAAIGTDPNRNYSYRWGCCRGSSGDPYSQTYRGWEPFSAPEVARLRDFVDAHGNIRTAISYHSYGDLVLYPYGYTYTDVPSDMPQLDQQTFVAMGAEMARTTGYTSQQSSDLYITDGDFNDWMYGAKRIYAFTFELSGYGYGFYPPDEYIPIEIAKNQAAAVYTAQIADCPTRAAGVSCDGSPPPPPSASTKTAYPAAAVIQTGTLRAGGAGDLGADDARYFEINAASSWYSATTAWYGRFTAITNSLTSPRVTYKGKNSAACSQTIAIWNWRTNAWSQLDARTVGTEVAIANLSPSGAAADYVSGASGDGEVRVRVRCTARSRFYASGNVLKLEYERPS